jgi:hypothetical protein
MGKTGTPINFCFWGRYPAPPSENNGFPEFQNFLGNFSSIPIYYGGTEKMMTIESILNEFQQNRGYFPQEAVQEAIQQQEEITPHLLHSLQESVRQPSSPELEESSFLPLYAMYLLAQFRDQRAYPLIIDLCKLPRENLDNLLGDLITEALPSIIASVFDGNIEPIKSVIENASVDEFVRGSALQSLSILVYEGVLPRGLL